MKKTETANIRRILVDSSDSGVFVQTNKVNALIMEGFRVCSVVPVGACQLRFIFERIDPKEHHMIAKSNGKVNGKVNGNANTSSWRPSLICGVPTCVNHCGNLRRRNKSKRYALVKDDPLGKL